MVGNSQFRDPWLDEAFASWAEAVVDRGEDLVDEDGARAGGPGRRRDDRLRELAGSTSELVYDKGGAALLDAREAAGEEAFDAAVRCYVDATAWSIATPDGRRPRARRPARGARRPRGPEALGQRTTSPR